MTNNDMVGCKFSPEYKKNYQKTTNSREKHYLVLEEIENNMLKKIIKKYILK